MRDGSFWQQIAALATSDDMRALNHAFEGIVSAWGFDRWTAVPIAGARLGSASAFEQAFGRPDPDWSVRYRERGYFERDAVLDALRKCDDPIWWSAFEKERAMGRESRRLFQEAREYGIAEGFTAPVASVDGSVWICALMGRSAEPDPGLSLPAMAAIQCYVRRGRKLRQRDAAKAASPLTKQQTHIVALIAEGLAPKIAAEAMGIRVKTVYNQLQAAKTRLKVKTIAELIFRSAELGLIGKLTT